MRDRSETIVTQPSTKTRDPGPDIAHSTHDVSGQVELLQGSDAQLVSQARDGCQQAFATLVHRYERKLIRILTRLVNDPELARDLAQETFWKVYTRLDRFDTSRRFAPWLFRVGTNLALDGLRRVGGPPTSSLDRTQDEDRPGFEPAEADPRSRVDLAQEVRHVLEKVPLSYRTIMNLRDLEGLSSAEVASIVNRREATIRWRLAKAREMFRDLWIRRWPDAKLMTRSIDDKI